MNDDTLIRGLPVGSVPLRLRRGPVVADAEAQVARAELVYQEAASAGFAEGMRRGRQEGASAGYEEGLRAGREEASRHAGEEAERAVGTATAALVEERARVARIADAWQGQFDRLAALAEDDMLALCFETICRIVGDVAVRPETVRSTLTQAMAAARDEARLLLHVHPDDAELLDRVQVTSAAGQAIAWRADPAVALGGCVLKFASGGIDARLEILLADCKAALLLAREARTGSRAAGTEQTP